MNVVFNENYKLARAKWIDKRLTELPDVRMGRLKDKDVVREYRVSKNGKRTHYNYLPTNKNYEYVCSIARERQSLINERLGLPGSGIKISPMGLIKMNDKKWNGIEQSANKQDFYGNYYHFGIRMRSRFELLVASVLSSLNLQFKYEPAMTINGETVYPDFLVYLPEIGICFVIECLGMVDDSGYAYHNAYKIVSYISEGFEVGRDIVFFSGKRDYLPDEVAIKNQIIRTINGLMDDSVMILHST